MPTLQTPSTTPGISIPALLRVSKPPMLRQLIGESTVQMMQELDPTLLDQEHIADFTERFVDPREALMDPLTRSQIISLLPLSKARELASRIGINSDRHVYDQLQREVAKQGSLSTLFSFFGVVADPRVPLHTIVNTQQIDPHYALFPHQRSASQRVIDYLANEPRKVVLHMPTGSGKTRTAMHIVASHLLQHEPTIVVWLAQSGELLEQAAAEFETSWAFLGNRTVSVTRFWGNSQADLLAGTDGLIVAGLGKLHALNTRQPNTLLRLADRSSLTVIDEAHQALAPTYESMLNALYRKNPANAVLGLTATPGRTWMDIDEDQRLADMFEQRKVTLDVPEYPDPVSFLISEGFLARPHFTTLESNAGVIVSRAEIGRLSAGADVPQALLERLGDDVQRNLNILKATEELTVNHRRVVVFASSVRSARLVASMLSLRGHEATVVTSQTDLAERTRIINRFKSDDSTHMIICNYGVLTTGFDAPSISAAVIARPTRSLVLYSQMVGRATRGPRVGGNSHASIVTVVDPHLPGFGSLAEAFTNWEDVWHDGKQ